MTERPVARGAFGDDWGGIYSERVAIKALRVYEDDDVKKLQRQTVWASRYPLAAPTDLHHKAFFKEVVMWKRISHPSIVPFLGVLTYLHPLVWYPNGCQTETCGTSLGRIRTPADCNWCVNSKLHRTRADETLVARCQSRSVILVHPRDCAWRFKRSTARLPSLVLGLSW